MNNDVNISGIHHITAIASSAAENLDLYEKVLGLRLVKKTVNFDDPYTYHLYYGDAAGAAGTISIENMNLEGDELHRCWYHI